MKIYVASSWRNGHQPEVVRLLRYDGHEVYDFRNPPPPGSPDGFRWSDIDEAWKDWSAERYVELLSHPLADDGFAADWSGMIWADACVYVMPCGVSASLEAGWCKGSGRFTVAYIPDIREPDLMVKMMDVVTTDLQEVRVALNKEHYRRYG